MTNMFSFFKGRDQNKLNIFYISITGLRNIKMLSLDNQEETLQNIKHLFFVCRNYSKHLCIDFPRASLITMTSSKQLNFRDIHFCKQTC